MMEMILQLLYFIAGVWLLVDLLSCLGGFPSLIRTIHHKVRGYIKVAMPDDLHTAWANGLIRKGDELVVAYQHEGKAGEVICFALSSGLVGCPAWRPSGYGWLVGL